ncbi:MAG: translation initiation factor IF-2 [Candidatus Omnitrophota bacterium]
MKISELAKKVKMPSKQLLIQVVKLGISATSAQSSLSEGALDKVLQMIAKKKPSIKVDEIKKQEDSKKKTKKKPAAAKKPVVKKKAITKEPVEKQGAKLSEKTVKQKKTTAKKPAVTEEKAKPQIKEGPSETHLAAEIKAEEPRPKAPPGKTLQVKFPIAVKDIAEKMSVGVNLVIKALMDMSIFANINQIVDEKDAKAVAEKFGYYLERLPTIEEEIIAIHEEEESDEKNLIHRPPVVTFMGHVDHGKTSLLDYIRESRITDKEKGGITQHIGAYEVSLDKGKITFLDTPGHAAFTAMRARGAVATDIVVLVVAADDGVMPQTIEALDHARAADVPIVVAINKVDKQNIDIDKLKKQLSELGFLAEDWGGKTVMVNVSAKTGQGVDVLLDMILLEAEMLELKANPKKPAKGIVIEAKITKGGGPIATVLVQTGTLRAGDVVVASHYYGKIKALINDRLKRVQESPPSMPVEILGLSGAPQAGDIFMVVEDEKKAKEICANRMEKAKEEEQAPTARRIALEDLYSEIQKGELKELKVILKTDVRGSLEAVSDSLTNLSTKNMTLNIIHKGVGDISESDILLAAASNAIVIGFHVRKTPEADRAGKAEHVDIRLYNIIYEAVSDIKAAMEGLLEPHIKESFMGRILVRQVFKITNSGKIAGCFVQKGKVTRNSSCRLIRESEEVYKGKISSLKRFKDDVKEMAEGFECGIALDNYQNIQPGDIIEVFALEKIARKL